MLPESATEWVAECRPDIDAPTPERTAEIREALVIHGVRRRQVRRQTRARTAALTLIVVAVAAIVTSQLTGGGQSRSPVAATPPAIVPKPAPADHAPVPRTPLTVLASYVRVMKMSPQRGDATLVVRDTFLDGKHVVDGAVYGGYDLYTDSGDYYYAPDSLAQLQQTVDAHQVTTGGGNEAHVLSVLAAAAGDTPQQARAVALATLPKPLSRAAVLRQTSHLPPAIRRKDRAAELPAKHVSARSERIGDDSNVYDIATEALEVGAGRPEVRAGAMKALDTLFHVSETDDRVHGIAALRVRFPDDGVLETIWLDARTGVPIQEQVGSNSATSFVVMRVNAAHLPSSVSTTNQLR